MRVFLPATLPDLRMLLDTGSLGAPPLTAYAVTPALREWYAEGDEEELEYTALTLAARASVRLLDGVLRAAPDAPARRVVVAAEVSDTAPDPQTDRAAVTVREPVTLALVQAVHVDDGTADADIRAAAEAVVAADLGGEEAATLVEQAEGHELQWFARQEIGPLLELL